MKPHSVVESLTTSAVKSALSRTPRQALLATRNRARSKWRGSSVVLRFVCPVNLRHVIQMLMRAMLVFRWTFAAHFVDVAGPDLSVTWLQTPRMWGSSRDVSFRCLMRERTGQWVGHLPRRCFENEPSAVYAARLTPRLWVPPVISAFTLPQYQIVPVMQYILTTARVL